MPQVAAQSQNEEYQYETNLEPKCKFELMNTLAGSKACDKYETNICERRSISTWVEFGRTLVRAKTPHTSDERCEELNRFMQVVQTGTAVCMDGNDRGVWTIRSYLFRRMRRDSIKRLDIDDMPVLDVHVLVPRPDAAGLANEWWQDRVLRQDRR